LLQAALCAESDLFGEEVGRFRAALQLLDQLAVVVPPPIAKNKELGAALTWIQQFTNDIRGMVADRAARVCAACVGGKLRVLC
jgi:hypothetical protein